MTDPHRQHWTWPGAFELDSGASIDSPVTAFETWGELAADGANAVLLTTGLTPTAHAARRDPADEPGWWEEMVGPGKALDTDRWFVVCSNVLGGCQGSTGPASPHPDDGRPYGSRFPRLTIRDMVRAQMRLMGHLGIEQWASVVGGSMGGMQVLEWAIIYPSRVRSIIPIASCMHASAQQIAWWSTGRRVISV